LAHGIALGALSLVGRLASRKRRESGSSLTMGGGFIWGTVAQAQAPSFVTPGWREWIWPHDVH